MSANRCSTGWPGLYGGIEVKIRRECFVIQELRNRATVLEPECHGVGIGALKAVLQPLVVRELGIFRHDVFAYLCHVL